MIDLATIVNIRDIEPEDMIHTCSYPGGCDHPAVKIFDEIDDDNGQRKAVYSCAYHLQGAYFAVYLALKTFPDPDQATQKACKMLRRNLEYLLRAEEMEANSADQRRTITLSQMALLIVDSRMISPQELSDVLDEATQAWMARKNEEQDNLISRLNRHLKRYGGGRKFSVHKLYD